MGSAQKSHGRGRYHGERVDWRLEEGGGLTSGSCKMVTKVCGFCNGQRHRQVGPAEQRAHKRADARETAPTRGAQMSEGRGESARA